MNAYDTDGSLESALHGLTANPADIGQSSSKAKESVERTSPSDHRKKTYRRGVKMNCRPLSLSHSADEWHHLTASVICGLIHPSSRHQEPNEALDQSVEMVNAERKN